MNTIKQKKLCVLIIITVVPVTKDHPFCGHWVVSRGGAVSCRSAKCTKKYYLMPTWGGHIMTSWSHIRGSLVAGTTVLPLTKQKC